MQNRWQFAVDVGGTFTDCIASSPDGIEYRYKLLSTGVVKGSACLKSGSSSFSDKRRCADPDDFWIGWSIRFLHEANSSATKHKVVQFDPETGTFQLDHPVDTVDGIYRYELHAELPAPIIAMRWVLKLPLAASLPPLDLRLGTTRGTNALLTRTGARTALITTRGFKDLLEIGNQSRPNIFELGITKHVKLACMTETVNERVSSTGVITTELEESSVEQAIMALKENGIESVAVCLLNSYRNSTHEQQIARLLSRHGFQHICCSSDFSSLINLVARAETTVVNAYLNPVLQQYIEQIHDELNAESSIRMMTSSGGLVNTPDFTGKDSVLSGPAGGVVGYSTAARVTGHRSAIGFDMGGTSTDVSRFDGAYSYEFETQKSGVQISTPMMAIETVAAGGGSICRFDGIKLTVGPASAGADPGPACYGRGGPLCVTDLNVHLGRIYPNQFPFPLDLDAIEDRLLELRQVVAEKTGEDLSSDELATGLLQIANENMAQAIRSISVAEGYDPKEYLLVSFGGAAGQHACAVSEQLGISSVLVHPDAGILSAYGIRHADQTEHAERGIYQLLHQVDSSFLSEWINGVAREVLSRPALQSLPKSQVKIKTALELRFSGLDASLVIPLDNADQDHPVLDEQIEAVVDSFHAMHKQKYGYTERDRELELVAVRIQATHADRKSDPLSKSVEKEVLQPETTTDLWSGGGKSSAGVFQLAELNPGNTIIGPAVVTDLHSTTIVDFGWQAELLSGHELLLSFTEADRPTEDNRGDPQVILSGTDPIQLEIYNNLFAAIAAQMGITLRNTSASVNVKERLDYSCAIFTEDGRLVVNAPHIPVHLGAMGETVRNVIDRNPVMRDGDVFVTNNPFQGGSHLPDVTVVTPVFNAVGKRLFFTASRAHHAEIGGISPGSMPPFSRHLGEEGVLIDDFKLSDAGQWCGESLLAVLNSGDYPSRNPETNLQDIQAQVAANHQGAKALMQLIADRGQENVLSFMNHIQSAASRKMRNALANMPDGDYQHRDALDDGSEICIRVTVEHDQAVIDFTGTSVQLESNLNANRAIVSAAVLYVMRLLIDEDIPLNHGVLEPVEIKLPTCFLNPEFKQNPIDCPAVAGGNVETSQRVVDVLLHALGLAACSQGTMNNLLFGNDTFGYYETICGGEGGTHRSRGASAVHTHMTNTRITDPEILEHRFPVRLDRFEVRKGSGGDGVYPGGDGIIRQISFHEPMTVSIITQRRGEYPPLGHSGGEHGETGLNTLVRSSGERELLDACCQIDVLSGDSIVIETPGGGGFGAV